MSREIETIFDQRVEKIRPTIESYLRNYESDSFWQRSSGSLIEYAVAYDGVACNSLQARLLYDLSCSRSLRARLVSEQTPKYPSVIEVPHHHALLMSYSLSRVAVAITMGRTDAERWLHSVEKFHKSYLACHGYSRDIAAVDDLDCDTALETMIPKAMVKVWTGEDYSGVMSRLSECEAVENAIWKYAYEVLVALRTTEAPSAWSAFVSEWRRGFVNIDHGLFDYSSLVLLYGLYCRATGIDFRMEDLAAHIRGSSAATSIEQ